MLQDVTAKKEEVKMQLGIPKDLHTLLKEMSQRVGKSMRAVILESMEYFVSGKSQAISRHDELSELMEGGDGRVSDEMIASTYKELESMLTWEWASLDDVRRKALVYIAIFPYESDRFVSKLCGSAQKYVREMRSSILGVEVMRHYGDRFIQSTRPEAYKIAMDEFRETRDKGWLELLQKPYGDNTSRQVVESTNRNISLDSGQKPQELMSPAEIDAQVIEMGLAVNMTPERYELLYNDRMLPAVQSETLQITSTNQSTNQTVYDG